MHPYLFHIGNLPIGTYGVFLAAGILVGLWIVSREVRRRGLPSDKVGDLNFYLFLAAIGGGRLTHVLVDFAYYREHPWEVIFSREGFVFYGGFIASVIVLIVFCRRVKLDPWRVGDCYGVAVPLAHTFGRVGCFFAGCCYGRACSGSWCVQFPLLSEPVIPVQLYEAAGNFALFLFLFFFLRRRQRFDGQMLLSYALLYAVLRFILEFWRGDPRGIYGPFSTSQWVCLVIFAGAAAMLWKKARHSQESGASASGSVSSTKSSTSN